MNRPQTDKSVIVWVDDERNPEMNLPWYKIKDRDENAMYEPINWVKTYNQFVETIEEHIHGSHSLEIYFDHDLGEKKTGLDCIKYLYTLVLEGKVKNKNIQLFCQSQNPVGKKAIENYIEDIHKLLQGVDK